MSEEGITPKDEPANQDNPGVDDDPLFGTPANQDDKADGGTPKDGASEDDKGKEEPGDEPKDKFLGKYPSQEAAIENHDRAMGGFASQLGELSKNISKLTESVSAIQQKGGGKEAPINPATGQPYTEAERQEEWNEKFRENPAAALNEVLGIIKQDGSKRDDALAQKVAMDVRKSMVFEGFISNNPDMNTEANLNLIGEIFETFPVLTRKKDALLNAKEIVLSPGATVEEKYNAWVLSKNKKAGDPVPTKDPVQIPGQAAITKGGKEAPKDNFAVLEKALGF